MEHVVIMHFKINHTSTKTKVPKIFYCVLVKNELKIYTRFYFYERLIKLVKRKLLIRNRVNDKTTLIDTSSIIWCNRQCHAKVTEQRTNATILHHRQRTEDDWGGFNYFIFQVSPTSMLTAAQWRFSWWLRAACIHLTISSALRNVLLPRGDPSYWSISVSDNFIYADFSIFDHLICKKCIIRGIRSYF